jgi:hypothetical protein
MLVRLLRSLALPSSINNPVYMALENFHNLATQIISNFYWTPDFVRMEFIKPRNGAVLLL